MTYFDATGISPEQGVAKHPVGKFPAIISDTKIEGKSEKDNHIIVFFTTPAGSIRKQYNINTESSEANMIKMAEIARSNLAALCHATGIFKLPTGKELINARCQIEVTPQANNDKYNEISKVYDANGNEPGKAPVAAPQPQQAGWGSQTQQPVVQPANAGWGAQQPPPQNNAPAPSPAPATNTWQPGPSAALGAPPPWANR